MDKMFNKRNIIVSVYCFLTLLSLQKTGINMFLFLSIIAIELLIAALSYASFKGKSVGIKGFFSGLFLLVQVIPVTLIMFGFGGYISHELEIPFGVANPHSHAFLVILTFGFIVGYGSELVNVATTKQNGLYLRGNIFKLIYKLWLLGTIAGLAFLLTPEPYMNYTLAAMALIRIWFEYATKKTFTEGITLTKETN